jgi:hypothetical protein
MSDRPKVILLLVFGVLAASLIVPRQASAQSSDGDRTWAVMDVTAALNNAIDESRDGAQLREKAVLRISECSLIYGGLSTLTQNADARKSYVRAQEATSNVEAAIAKPLQTPRRLQLEESARRSVALMLRSVKAQGDKEVGPLLRSCKALNDVNEIRNALRELPPL